MDNLLYFPNITIPKTDWLYKSLLYWDKVETITPEYYLNKPESFDGNHMVELLQSGLVLPVMPINYIHMFPDFESDFLKFVNRKYAPILGAYKRKNYNMTFATKVHIEKLDTIGYELERMGLAYNVNGWFHMHRSVANDFMFYLAVLIGQERNSLPISDEPMNVRTKIIKGNQLQRNRINREGLRRTFLENLFPTPMKINNVDDLYMFKQRHENQLKNFRKYIERELLKIDAAPEQFKDELILELYRNIEEEKCFIYEKMKERWKFINFSSFLKVSEAGTMIMGAGNNYGYAGAAISIIDLIYSTIGKSRRERIETLNRPLAYAYLLHTKFGTNKNFNI